MVTQNSEDLGPGLSSLMKALDEWEERLPLLFCDPSSITPNVWSIFLEMTMMRGELRDVRHGWHDTRFDVEAESLWTRLVSRQKIMDSK